MIIIRPIMATNLKEKKGGTGRLARNLDEAEGRDAHSGCKLLIPNLDEIAPVMNGRTALPAWPKPAIQPMDPVRIHRGRTRPAWFIAIGYMGPRRTPTSETATAFPMSEGTNQITNSRLEG